MRWLKAEGNRMRLLRKAPVFSATVLVSTGGAVPRRVGALLREE